MVKVVCVFWKDGVYKTMKSDFKCVCVGKVKRLCVCVCMYTEKEKDVEKGRQSNGKLKCVCER